MARKNNRPIGVVVGDVLYSSWGYEQTNINFYQVTKVVGKRMIEICEIESKTIEQSGYETYKVMPFWNKFKGKTMRKACTDGNVKINSVQYARKTSWDTYHVKTSYY